jgi:hypothetical protein
MRPTSRCPLFGRVLSALRSPVPRGRNRHGAYRVVSNIPACQNFVTGGTRTTTFIWTFRSRPGSPLIVKGLP